MREQYATMRDFEAMPLEQVEATLTKYLQIAEDSDWDITPAFENTLKMLTQVAKFKGSTKRW